MSGLDDRVEVRAVCENPKCRREFSYSRARKLGGPMRLYCQKSCRRNLREREAEDAALLLAGLKKRAKPGTSGHAKKLSRKRPKSDPVTCEFVYSDEETAFFKAVEDYKKRFRRPFPALCEMLEVLKCLGYRKVADPIPVPDVPARATDPPECW